jgi:hypothetical protein
MKFSAKYIFGFLTGSALATAAIAQDSVPAEQPKTENTQTTQPRVIFLPPTSTTQPMVVSGSASTEPMAITNDATKSAAFASKASSEPSIAIVTEKDIAVNTPIVVTSETEITAKKLKEPKQIFLKTMEDISRQGKVFIPAGTKVTAQLIPVKKSGGFGRAGTLEIKFEALELADGTVVKLSGTHSETGQRSDTQAANNLAHSAAALSGFGAVGALAGLLGRAAVSGKSAKVNANQKLTAYIADKIELDSNGNVALAKPAEIQVFTLNDEPAAPTTEAAK